MGWVSIPESYINCPGCSFKEMLRFKFVLIQVNPLTSNLQVRQVVVIRTFWTDEVWHCHSSFFQALSKSELQRNMSSFRILIKHAIIIMYKISIYRGTGWHSTSTLIWSFVENIIGQWAFLFLVTLWASFLAGLSERLFPT